MTSDTLREARDYIAGHNVMTLATYGELGPWASAVFYAYEAGNFYFLSAPHTRHSGNISRDARVAAAIQQEYGDWKAIKGLQIEGRARRIEAAQTEKIVAIYARKFPIIGSDAPPEIAGALDKVGWYALTPSRVHYIDNSKGLGHREDIDVSALA